MEQIDKQTLDKVYEMVTQKVSLFNKKYPNSRIEISRDLIDLRNYILNMSFPTISSTGNENPLMTEETYSLNIELVSIESHNAYICILKSTEPVFHPHFENNSGLIRNTINKIRKSYNYKFIDYSNKENEELFDFILRVINCLRICKTFFNTEANNIGNYEAKLWLSGFIRKFPTYFDESTEFNLESLKGFKVGEESKKQEKKSSKKFKISESTDVEPKKKINDNEIKDLVGLDHIESTKGNLKSKNTIVIQESAFLTINKHIGWGAKTKLNTVEQGGLLIGDIFINDKSEFIGVATDAIVAKNAEGNATYLKMDHEVWQQMLDDLDNLNEALHENKKVIGWYHTHPNALDVFMSGTDMNTQQKSFYQDWHFAIVINPHKQIWKAFSGINASECKGYFITESNS